MKRFGPITAVDGLDLDVPKGICLGLLGPNGAGKSTTMRLLTGQAHQDEGEIRVLGYELPRESKEARALMGVVPQLDNLDVDVSVEDNLAVFARLYRVPDVRAAVDRGLALARLENRRRDAVDGLSGGMRRRLLLARGLIHEPQLVLLDEPTVGLDPQIRTQLWSLIDALRSRGTTILMSTHYIEEAERLADEVAVMTHGKVISRGKPAELVAQHAGRETAEVYAPPAAAGRGPREGGGARPQGASRGAGDRDRGLGEGHRRRRPARGDPPRRVARGRVRDAHRGGGGVNSEAAQAPPAPRMRRLEPAAIGGVMSREVANFRTFWKATTFSSVLEPVIYLLAFGLGLGATLVNRVDGLDYVEYVGTGMVATAVIFSSALPAMFGTFVKERFQRTYDAILAAPVDVEELVTAEMLFIGLRSGFYGCFPLIVSMLFGLDPAPGMLLVPFFCFFTALGFAAFGIAVAASVSKIDQFNYVTTLVITPLFLVAGTFFPISQLPEGVQIAAQANPLHQLVELVRDSCFGFKATDLLRVAFLVTFAVLLWRVAVSRMEKRLID